MRTMRGGTRLNCQDHTYTWQFPTPESVWMRKRRPASLNHSLPLRRSVKERDWVSPPSTELSGKVAVISGCTANWDMVQHSKFTCRKRGKEFSRKNPIPVWLPPSATRKLYC